MTPPRLLGNRAFVGLNAATLLIYGGLAIMFFSVVVRSRRPARPDADQRRAGVPAVHARRRPVVAAVRRHWRTRSARATMLIVGPLGAALAFLWLALGQNASLALGVLAPMTLLGISFAVLVAPLTASVMSSVATPTRGSPPASTTR